MSDFTPEAGEWHPEEGSFSGGEVLEPHHVSILTGNLINEDGVDRRVMMKLDGNYLDDPGQPYTVIIGVSPAAAAIIAKALDEAVRLTT